MAGYLLFVKGGTVEIAAVTLAPDQARLPPGVQLRVSRRSARRGALLVGLPLALALGVPVVLIAADRASRTGRSTVTWPRRGTRRRSAPRPARRSGPRPRLVDPRTGTCQTPMISKPTLQYLGDRHWLIVGGLGLLTVRRQSAHHVPKVIGGRSPWGRRRRATLTPVSIARSRRRSKQVGTVPQRLVHPSPRASLGARI
ncbi:hypothetical protein ACLQ24_22555 [Micromonospora sp. DT4]|uniref:hypothetical protein n=1 Tax=Micromonospora sp. DT4 TaxID=3393438 RepID=UPI003CF4FE36